VNGFAKFGFTILIVLVGAFAAAAISNARSGERPTISGEPIVGQTLTSSAAGDSGLYRWQSCDPAIASCADGPANDGDWTDILGASGHDAQAYTLTAADLGHFIRVLAKGTSLGEQFASSEPVGPVTGTTTPVQGPVPQHGIQLIGTPARGTVKFKPPGGTTFRVLSGTTAIPVGSVIDTRGSEIRLTAATGPYADQTEDKSVNFGGGLFRITQSGDLNSPAIAKLVGKLACGKPGGGSAKASAGGPTAVASRRRGKKGLWGSGSGNYGTSGRGGTGSVVGTTWLTKDTCKGTLFYVAEGTGISVFDFSSKKTTLLGPGQKYFAPRH
jgi:hypothetical protein